MKRVVRVVLLASAMLAPASVQAAPTFAASGDRSQVNPSQLCANNGDTIIVQFGPGPQDSFPLSIPSHGGCVSTLAAHGTVVSPGQVVVAGGDYSQAAFVAQCKVLKTMLPAELWTAPVNIVQTDQGPSNVGGFGGKIETCASLIPSNPSRRVTRQRSWSRRDFPRRLQAHMA